MVIVLPALLGLSMLAAGCSDDDERRQSSDGSRAVIRLSQPRTMTLPRAPAARPLVVDISRADPPDEHAPRARRVQPALGRGPSDRAQRQADAAPASQPSQPASLPTNLSASGPRARFAAPTQRREPKREPRWVPERHFPAW